MPRDRFRIQRPDDGRARPIVVDVPHAGEWIPDQVAEEMLVEEDLLKRDLDLYVDRFWQDAPEVGATLIASNVSRYVVDLNRAPDDVSPEAVEGAETKDEPGYYQDRGVVWRTTTGGEAVLDEPLSPEAFQERLDEFYWPYHRALRKEIERVREQFGTCILVDGHSMPSEGRQKYSDPGRRRADIVPGDVDGTSCRRPVRWTVEEHFRDDGYSVKTNDPYKGGWITRKYGAPDDGVHALQIEVNRDLYMDEQSFEIDEPGLNELRESCRSLVDRLADLDL
ncbi:MAG: N-formylglutamate amidohydrolase [Bradymonadaceae bacterium]